jgi:hypothetical protein
MDLVDLYYAKFGSCFGVEWVCRRVFLSKVGLGIFLVLGLFLKPAILLGDESTTAKSLKGYGSFRDFLLSEMAKAQRRVWLYTEYLSDGDISSSLFLAKYRKLDVQVLLGSQKAQKYMSRLSNLKANQIDVFLKPKNFRIDDHTVMLIDDRLLRVNHDLDFMTTAQEFVVNFGQTQDSYEFSRKFSLAMEQKKPAIPKPLPAVGRAHSGPSEVYSPPSRGNDSQKSDDNTPKNLAPESSEAYHYKRIKEKKPPEVPDRLPKVLKYQERDREALPLSGP